MADIHFHIWLYKRGPDGIIRSMERTGEQFDTRRKANYGPDSTACCTWTPNQVVLPHPGGPTTRYSAASVSVFFTVGIVFSLLHAVFHPGSPSKIVSTPYIYRDELLISITHCWLSTFDSSCLLVVSRLSSL